jgi:hypothetical protein
MNIAATRDVQHADVELVLYKAKDCRFPVLLRSVSTQSEYKNKGRTFYF